MIFKISKRILAGALLIALMAGCSKQEQQQREQLMIGELERLGPGGRDYLVLGIDAPGFEALTLQQKEFAYYLYRAAVAGNDIMYGQNHRYALEIKNLLEAIHLNRGGLDENIVAAVHDYLKYIWINHGNYEHYSHEKFVPNSLTPEMLKKAAEHVQANGIALTNGGESLDQKLQRLQPAIFDKNWEQVAVNQQAGVDIIASSAVNLFDRGITSEMLEHAPKNVRHRLNVRFALKDGKAVPEFYKIGGVHGEYLENCAYWLEKAMPLAESEEQRKGLEALINFYNTGDENLFREYCVHWLKSNTTIDYLNGFIEQYMDPRGLIGQFEGNVSYVADSKLIDRLADQALYFEQRMPWPDQWKRSQISKPVANVVNVLVETGDSGPISPAAYNLPNYGDIRRDVGSKNIILHNVSNAQSQKIYDATIEEFYLPEYREVMQKHGQLGRTWLVYMHEVIGHGSGQQDPAIKTDTQTMIGRTYNALEECRADAVALYHIFDDMLVEIGAFTTEEQPQVILATYIRHLQGWLNAYRTLETEVVREAHDRGHQVSLSFLVEGGLNSDEDYGVKVVEENGNFYVKITDIELARQGVADYLNLLQTYKSTGDGEASTKLFDRFGSRVNADWQRNIKERAAKIAIPNHTAYVFPRLESSVDAAGKISDVKIFFDEDLTAQQLRFNRIGKSRD
jgi:dipeptidyl-peptidase-3